MRIVGLVIILIALFAAAYTWYSRHEPTPPAANQAAALVVPTDEEAEQKARRDRFGPDALDPAIQWRESGLGYRITEPGTPPRPGVGTAVRLKYVGRLKDGTVFDRAETPSEFLIGATIPGLSTGLQMLGTGGKAVFYIPPSLGYGNRKVMGIPPSSGLIFEVEVVEIVNR